MSEWVPLSDPHAENVLSRDAILAAITAVVDSNALILGPHVAAFETEMAASVGAAGAVGVASGTDALVLALLAAGVDAGDEVIAPSHTAGPTIAAIHMIGAIPVLVDIDEANYCIDPEAASAAISARTKALIAVHLYGHPADMTFLGALAKKHGIALIEDCAQAQGAIHNGQSIGSIGALGCFSFYPTKNLGALGDGGAVTANDPDLLEKLRALRIYGWKKPQFAELAHGRCSRLDEMQAAILSVKIKTLDGMIKRRRKIAQMYRDGLSDLPLILPVDAAGCRHAYHLFVLRSASRDALEQYLATQFIRTGRHYPFPTHQQPALAAGARIPSPLKVTERIAGEILSLPMFATMSDEQVARTVEAVRMFHTNG